MTKIIALFNQSGGVGKTSLTMNLGYQLAQRDRKVLLVDMDPQSSLTSFLGLDIYQLDKTIYQSITQYESLSIHHNIHGMDLVPSNIQLSAAEMELVLAEFREVRLKDAIATVQEQYDFILIDCPPSLAILSYISLIAATHVLVPIQTHYKSLVGCNLLLETVARVRQRANRNLKVAGFIPTMHEGQTLQAKTSLTTIQTQLSSIATVYPPIPRTIAFPDSAQMHEPLGLHSPKHPVIDILNQITDSLETI
ncbi:ParA family protein [Pseudanabaena mucicola]|uniref:ParA family protein n=1 Tax=Pseudanabaena mucicola FACHB-723 TaxID=2692860 RepID=A0ABR8A3X6_9CYAN|nr:AAA family ATPase [Pseudanabaena mucicola]MBD2190006.1 ParA family protein [Pseudanabaena mucicola FACHB-723]